MTDDERNALLLAARLLESGAVLESPDLGEGGHVNVALTLADRLRQATDDADDALQIIASLRSAAQDDAEA